LARGYNKPGTDDYIKGFLAALEYVYDGHLTQKAATMMGVADDVEVEPMQDYMPREKEIKPDGR
jgi:hypothetical protein